MRIAIARYPFDAIISGVAIFEAKQSTGSLPEGADGRYLLGIVRNVQEQREHKLLADVLHRLRQQARDIALQRRCDERDALLASERPTNDVLSSLVDRALLSESALDRTFWLNALASFVGKAPSDEREALYRSATRYIHATFRADPRLRQQAICFLAEQLLPLT